MDVPLWASAPLVASVALVKQYLRINHWIQNANLGNLISQPKIGGSGSGAGAGTGSAGFGGVSASGVSEFVPSAFDRIVHVFI